MDLQLKGKTVVLTGASKGIGRAALQLFAEEGATVIGSARGIEEMEAEAEALRGQGHDVTAFQCDVTKDEDVDKLIDFAKTKSGRIDIFVNNAAGKLPAGEFLGISNDDWLAGWNEKLQCYIRTCRAVFPVMQQQGGGRIVNVLGTAARNPRTSYMPVGVTNAALVNFNKSLADYGAKHNILVSAVAPSGVLTDRWHRLIRKRAEGEGKSPEQLQTEMDKTFPLGRMATPEELANMIVFVASPRASYHSGTVVIVDGASTSGVFN